MTESKEKSNFWTTLPGILTGLAALITAIGTILLGTNAVLKSPNSGLDPNGGGINPNAVQTTWTCYNKAKSVGDVTIWWGHNRGDAEWACNNWISTCGDEGGCTANKISK
jgi:hypothetical protein